jgi:hypothetical protein
VPSISVVDRDPIRLVRPVGQAFVKDYKHERRSGSARTPSEFIVYTGTDFRCGPRCGRQFAPRHATACGYWKDTAVLTVGRLHEEASEQDFTPGDARIFLRGVLETSRGWRIANEKISHKIEYWSRLRWRRLARAKQSKLATFSF